MAVPGRKVSDVRDSVSMGSAEAFDHICEPCLTIGQYQEAHGLCLECQEYLCKTCLAYHQRTKASRHHTVLGKDNMDNRDGNAVPEKESCTEHCSLHTMESIKYFCPNHGALGCPDCIIMNHKSCKIEYIPEKCGGIGDSEEYRGTLMQLDQEVKKLANIIKQATIRVREIDTCHDAFVKQVLKFRQDLNDCLDNMLEKAQRKVEERRNRDQKIVQNVIDACTDISTDIKRHKTKIEENKQSNQNVQLYIALKRAEAKLKTDEVQTASKTLRKTHERYSFDVDKEIDKLIRQMDFAKQTVFGKLSLSATEKLMFSEDINVRTKTDKETCYITGCAVLSPNKLVLVDNHNNKCKIVDTNSKLIEEKKLNCQPYDIAVLTQDQFAVTFPKEKEILIIDSSAPGKILPTESKIRVNAKCYGITYKYQEDSLYVVCGTPPCVLILDTEGIIHSDISLESDMFQSPSYVVPSQDSKHIHLSDWGSNSVVEVRLDGSISASCTHAKLDRPQGLLLQADGSLLVCCWNGTIHYISSDLKQRRIILDGLDLPKSLCYNHLQQQVYIGSVSDKLHVFNVK